MNEKGALYFSDEDIKISYDSIDGEWIIDFQQNGTTMDAGYNGPMVKTNGEYKGIIYASGNIYIDTYGAPSDFSFKGAVIAGKNIAFLGADNSRKVNISYDINVLKSLYGNNSGIAELFYLNEYGMSYGSQGDFKIKSQKMDVRDIGIIEWRQV